MMAAMLVEDGRGNWIFRLSNFVILIRNLVLLKWWFSKGVHSYIWQFVLNVMHGAIFLQVLFFVSWILSAKDWRRLLYFFHISVIHIMQLRWYMSMVWPFIYLSISIWYPNKSPSVNFFLYMAVCTVRDKKLTSNFLFKNVHSTYFWDSASYHLDSMYFQRLWFFYWVEQMISSQ